MHLCNPVFHSKSADEKTFKLKGNATLTGEKFSITSQILSIFVHMKCFKRLFKLKVYFPKQKITMNEILIFLKMIPLKFNTLITASFLMVKGSLWAFVHQQTPHFYLFIVYWVFSHDTCYFLTPYYLPFYQQLSILRSICPAHLKSKNRVRGHFKTFEFGFC